jgi:hypothetical protein
MTQPLIEFVVTEYGFASWWQDKPWVYFDLRSPELPEGWSFHVWLRPSGGVSTRRAADGNGSVRYVEFDSLPTAFDYGREWFLNKLDERRRRRHHSA